MLDVDRYRTQNLQISKKFSYLCFMDGLNIKRGRLINDRPEPEMGISKMARMRKELKRAEKVRMIAEANELANANINLFKKL